MRLNFKIRFTTFVIIAIALGSCQKVVDLHLPEHVSKLVINAIAINDSLIKVEVSNSVGALTTNRIDTISNAKITITNSLGQSEDLKYIGAGNYSTTNHLGLAGTNYNIVASAIGFNDVSAQFNLPPQQSIDTSYFKVIDEQKQLAELVVKFTDNGSIANYYSISIANIDSFGSISANSFKQPDNSIGIGRSEDYFGSEYYFTDELDNGKQIEKHLQFNYYNNSSYDSLGNPIPSSFDNYQVLWLRSLSKEYYLYKKSYNTYLGAVGNPFAEPVQVYNNINGGFGIAAGYSQTIKLIQKIK